MRTESSYIGMKGKRAAGCMDCLLLASGDSRLMFFAIRASEIMSTHSCFFPKSKRCHLFSGKEMTRTVPRPAPRVELGERELGLMRKMRFGANLV